MFIILVGCEDRGTFICKVLTVVVALEHVEYKIILRLLLLNTKGVKYIHCDHHVFFRFFFLFELFQLLFWSIPIPMFKIRCSHPFDFYNYLLILRFHHPGVDVQPNGSFASLFFCTNNRLSSWIIINCFLCTMCHCSCA